MTSAGPRIHARNISSRLPVKCFHDENFNANFAKRCLAFVLLALKTVILLQCSRVMSRVHFSLTSRSRSSRFAFLLLHAYTPSACFMLRVQEKELEIQYQYFGIRA